MYSGIYPDMAGSIPSAGNEAAWLYLRQIGQCGCIGTHHLVSGRDTTFSAYARLAPTCQRIGTFLHRQQERIVGA